MKNFIMGLIVVVAFTSATVTATFTDVGADLFEAKCASCHGADGKGDTAMGKNLKLRDPGVGGRAVGVGC